MPVSRVYTVTCQDAAGNKRSVAVTAGSDAGASEKALRDLNSWRVVRVLGLPKAKER